MVLISVLELITAALYSIDFLVNSWLDIYYDVFIFFSKLDSPWCVYQMHLSSEKEQCEYSSKHLLLGFMEESKPCGFAYVQRAAYK